MPVMVTGPVAPGAAPRPRNVCASDEEGARAARQSVDKVTARIERERGTMDIAEAPWVPPPHIARRGLVIAVAKKIIGPGLRAATLRADGGKSLMPAAARGYTAGAAGGLGGARPWGRSGARLTGRRGGVGAGGRGRPMLPRPQ